MPDDRLRQIFEQIAELRVDVPPADRARSRGRQRQGRARLRMSTIAATISLAAGFGAPVSGSLAGSPGPPVPLLRGVGSPHALYTIHAVNGPASAASGGPDIPRTTPPGRPVPRRLSAGRASMSRALLLLPPPGDGQLILGLDRAHRYVMTRVGAARSPVQVPGLKAVAGARPVLATNPAGGWVVALASRQTRTRVVAARLARVMATGRSVRFGPKFTEASVTSVAVSLDGSRVAVALAGLSGQARIEVLPLPGHAGAQRSWQVPTGQADLVTGLSWAPDGRHLSYMAGQRASTGTADSPMTMDTAVSVLPPPVRSYWQRAISSGMTCVPVAMAWLGRTGRSAMLEECASTGTVVLQTNASTGAASGQPLVVAHQMGCESPALDPNASGNRILISYCGVYLDDHGKLTRASDALTTAALSGLRGRCDRVQVPNRRCRAAYDRSARRKSTFLKAGQYASQK